MNEINYLEINKSSENSCLFFLLHDKMYGINVNSILEIINLPKLDIPQKMPKYIMGIMNYNKLFVKIIDLYSVLSHKIQSYSVNSQVIIIKTEESIFGFVVNKAVDIRPISSENIQSLPYHSEDNLIQYLYSLNDELVPIIDLNSVQNIIQKTQFEANDFDANELFPQDEQAQRALELRRNELVKKFETNIGQIYYDQEQYIIFSLEKNLYALSIKKIKEIVNLKHVSMVKLPSVYDYIEGVFNLRGDFISAINFKKFMDIKEYSSKTEKSMLIVLEVKDFKIALLVDEIIDIVTVTPNEIVSKIDNKFDSKYIISELHIQDKIVSVVSIDKLVSDERLYIKD